MPKKSAAQPLKIPEDALAGLFLELWQYDQEESPWSAKALRKAGREFRPEAFTGKFDVLSKVIGQHCLKEEVWSLLVLEHIPIVMMLL